MSPGKKDENLGFSFFRNSPKRGRMTKYQRWYDSIIDVAKYRIIPTCYTELHHIKPRSLGGADTPENLVRLTYREHFLVHWLLTKTCVGADLRRMQRALLAMTMQANGNRIVSGWQFEAAKRAVRDIELDPVAEEAWRAANLAEANARIRELRRKEENFLRFKRPLERVSNRELVRDVVSSVKLDKASLNLAANLFLSSNRTPPKRHEQGVDHARRFRSNSIKGQISDPRRKRLKRMFSELLNNS